jgi:hypothetical protein
MSAYHLFFKAVDLFFATLTRVASSADLRGLRRWVKLKAASTFQRERVCAGLAQVKGD